MTRLRLLAATAALAAPLTLAACGASEDEPSAADDTTPAASAAAEDAFPVTIEHAFGETTIESRPERIATVAWANHEVPLRSASCRSA